MPALTDAPANADGLSFILDHTTTAGWVICGILVILSMGSWAAMVSKLRQVRLARRENRVFIHDLKRSPHPLARLTADEPYDLAPVYHVYHEGCRELCFYLLGSDAIDSTFTRRLQTAGRITPSQMASVREAMDRAVGEATLRLESNLGIVATALTGAPFLGLLGTVWGVMDSFSGLAYAHSGTGLQALAPGLSAAMLTTVAGLIVAIPSMFGYNYLVSRIRELVARMEHFEAQFASILDRHFVDHHAVSEPLPSLGEMGSPQLGSRLEKKVARELSTEPVS